MLHAIRATTLTLTTLLLALFATVAPSPFARLAAQEQVMLILDSSGSMWGQVEGVNKHLIARDVIGTVLANIGDKVNMGVMAYGHRRKGDCRDIETLISVGPVDAEKYMNRIKKLQPRGKTPITAAVRKAAETLKYTEEKATIVLISDGLETCRADPCALASELEKLGVDFTIHVVGFDLGNEDTKTLSCLAENTGGLFLQAGNASELSAAIGQVVEKVQQPQASSGTEPKPEPDVAAKTEAEAAPEPEPKPAPEPEPVAGPTLLLPRALLAEGGEPLDDAYFRVYHAEQNAQGKREEVTYGGGAPKFEVEAGKYYVTAKHGEVLTGLEVDIAEGKENVVDIVLNAGLVQPIAYLAEGIEPLSDAYFRVFEAEQDAAGNRKQVTYGGGKPMFTVPAGPHRVTAKSGDAEAGLDIDIKAGEVHMVHIVLNAGFIVPTAFWTEGGEAVKDAYFRIYETAEDAEAKRKQVTYGGGERTFTVPAGEYYITAQAGDTQVGQAIAVVPGERTEVSLVLGAGILRPTAYYTEGGDAVSNAYFRVYELEQNAEGERKQVSYGGGTPTFKLPAGKYYITASVGDVLIGRETEVRGGEATDIALVLGAGILAPTASYEEGGDPVKKAYFRVFELEQGANGKRKQVANRGGTPQFKLPAGKYYLTAKIGEAEIGQEVEVNAGEKTEVAMVLGAGVLSLLASATEGGDPVKKVYFRVFEAKKSIEGKRKQVTAGGGQPKFSLPAGQYVATVTWGEATAEAEVEVKPGELSEVTINLNAGRVVAVAVDAEGKPIEKGVYYRLFEARKDIEGKRRQVKAGGGKSLEASVPAGKYVVQISVGARNNIAGEAEVDVAAGALAEVSVPAKADE